MLRDRKAKFDGSYTKWGGGRFPLILCMESKTKKMSLLGHLQAVNWPVDAWPTALCWAESCLHNRYHRPHTTNGISSAVFPPFVSKPCHPHKTETARAPM